MITVEATGLDKLTLAFQRAPKTIQNEIQKALKDVVAYMETESKRNTPVDTGLLRSSIAGVQGYSSISGLRAEFGTNVKYALFVHEGHGKHKVGDRLFFEKGVKSSEEYIQRRFAQLGENIANNLTK